MATRFTCLVQMKLGVMCGARVIFASQISLSVGLVGVFLEPWLGHFVLGGISGLVGGWVDNIIQRLDRTVAFNPRHPAVDGDWQRLFRPVGIRLWSILELQSFYRFWAGQVWRVSYVGAFLALREEDFILAAELDGVPRHRIITKHMVPSFLSHIIASITLAIPGMILG